jgi:hypothetical protein
MDSSDHPILRLVGDNESIATRARLGDAEVVVTSHRLLVASPERTMLNVPIAGLRRIQFDIERQRPATLVIVPEAATDEPQVLAVSPAHYREVADALVIVGERLANMDP